MGPAAGASVAKGPRGYGVRMFGRWRRKEKHRADKQQGDPAALEREGDPRGGLQSPEYRQAAPTDHVEAEGVAMSGPGGAPQEDAAAEERHDRNR